MRTLVVTVEKFINIFRTESNWTDEKTAQDATVYENIDAIATRGRKRVNSASTVLLFKCFINRPYLKATSRCPLNHLVRCLRNGFKAAGLSCHAQTSGAYFIL